MRFIKKTRLALVVTALAAASAGAAYADGFASFDSPTTESYSVIVRAAELRGAGTSSVTVRFRRADGSLTDAVRFRDGISAGGVEARRVRGAPLGEIVDAVVTVPRSDPAVLTVELMRYDGDNQTFGDESYVRDRLTLDPTSWAPRFGCTVSDDWIFCSCHDESGEAFTNCATWLASVPICDTTPREGEARCGKVDRD